MQKLETRNGALVFVEVPENSKYRYEYQFDCPNILYSYIDGEWFGNGVAHLLDRTSIDDKEYEILGEVTKEGITFDIAEFGFVGELIKASIPYTHEDLFRYYLWDNGIELREGYKFIVLKEK